ncbi:MAG: chromosome segregation protein SMC, partial [Nitrospinota bacterium]
MKSLELLGFKSFLSRTVLEFGPGFTAIVGPNGCGKSNISDAVRWVLGEQSPKSLRGKRMEDVIFSGSGGKKPLGMAEVSLTLTDVSGTVSIPPWRDYHELTITRRLYRSGESEYLINKTPCRLKDIIELFLDTGISTSSFTLVEQGKVEALISAKPEDRRVLIEEAAGVMRYKHRRNAALRKLEGAEANLLRLTDIIQEVERQCRSLKRQARKAKYFKQYQAEMKELELKLSSLEYSALDGELAPLEEEFRRLNEEVHLLEAATSASEARAEALRAELTRRGEALTKARERYSELGLRIESLESQGELLSRQLQDLERRDKERGRELGALREELQGLLLKQRDARGRREALFLEVQAREERLRERESELGVLKEELAEREEELARAGASSLSAADALTRARTEQSLMRSEEESLQRALERLREEREALARKSEALSVRRAEGRRGLSQALILQNSLKYRRGRLKETLDEERERSAELLNNLSRRREELGALSFQLESFRKEEGDGDGMGALLARSEELGLRGPLSELLNVKPPFEKAIEALLGERLKGMLAQGPREGAAALELLKGQGGGRATFLPLKPRMTEREAPEPGRVPGLIGRAAELVSAPEEIGPALESLLGQFYVVEDLGAALSLWEKGEAPAMVTLEGEVLLPPGELTGGTPRAGALEKKRQRRELEERARLLEAEMEALSEALKEAEARKESLGEELESLEEALRGAELERVAASSALDASEREGKELGAELETLGLEEEGLLSEMEKLSEKLSQGSSRLAELSTELKARDEATSRLSSLFEELGGRVKAKEAQVTEARISLVEGRAQLQNAEAEEARLEDNLTSLSERIRRGEEEGSILSQKAQEIQVARQRG